MKFSAYRLVLLLAALLCVAGCRPSTHYVTVEGSVLGTTFRIKARTTLPADEIYTEVMALDEEMKHSMSIFDETSLLSRINRGESDSLDSHLIYNILAADSVSPLFRGLSCKSGFHLTLGIVLRFHFIPVHPNGFQVFLLHRLRLFAKYLIQHPIVDIGSGEIFLAETKAVAFNLFHTQRKRRRKVPQQPVNGIRGNFPNAEETQHARNGANCSATEPTSA